MNLGKNIYHFRKSLMTMNLNFDWLDGILSALSFVGGLYLFGDVSWFVDCLPTMWLVIYSVRRLILKSSIPSHPKSGIIWRLSSIFGLLLTFLPVLTGAPNCSLMPLATEAEMREMTASLFIFTVLGDQ